MESLFNKAAGTYACDFVKKGLQHAYFEEKKRTTAFSFSSFKLDLVDLTVFPNLNLRLTKIDLLFIFNELTSKITHFSADFLYTQ